MTEDRGVVPRSPAGAGNALGGAARKQTRTLSSTPKASQGTPGPTHPGRAAAQTVVGDAPHPTTTPAQARKGANAPVALPAVARGCPSACRGVDCTCQNRTGSPSCRGRRRPGRAPLAGAGRGGSARRPYAGSVCSRPVAAAPRRRPPQQPAAAFTSQSRRGNTSGDPGRRPGACRRLDGTGGGRAGRPLAPASLHRRQQRRLPRPRRRLLLRRRVQRNAVRP
jgi:hypothetical protein